MEKDIYTIRLVFKIIIFQKKGVAFRKQTIKIMLPIDYHINIVITLI